MGRLGIAVAAIVAVALLTAGMWQFGLHLDDYFMLRAHGWAELRRVWHGTWDTGQVWPDYYRPLAVWANAATFAITGFNVGALHIVVWVELVVMASLLGLFIRRELRSDIAGMFAAGLVIVQPAATASLGWYFQQNHRWASIFFIAALLLWQRRRHTASAAAWWPIHLAVLAGCLFKEDVIVAEPVLIAWQWMRARWIGDVPAPPARMVAVMAGGCAAAALAHVWALGDVGAEIGGRAVGLDGIARELVRNLYVGLIRFRDMHTATSGMQRTASALTALVWLGAIAAVGKGHTAGAMLVGQGITLAFAAALTMVVAAPWYMRHHVIAMGGVMIASGCLCLITELERGRWLARSTGCALLAACLLASRGNLLSYGPCSDKTLSDDAQMIDWIGMPPAPEFRRLPQWFDLKFQMCETGDRQHINDAFRRWATEPR